MKRLWMWINADMKVKRRFGLFILGIFIYIFIAGRFHDPLKKCIKECTRITDVAIAQHDRDVRIILGEMLSLQNELTAAKEELKIREQLDMDGFIEVERETDPDRQDIPECRTCRGQVK